MAANDETCCSYLTMPLGSTGLVAQGFGVYARLGWPPGTEGGAPSRCHGGTVAERGVVGNYMKVAEIGSGGPVGHTGFPLAPAIPLADECLA